MRLRVAAVLTAVFVCAGTIEAQSPVRAFISPAGEVGLGASFVLNVEVTGTQDVRRDIQLPDLSAFAQFLGSSTQTSTRMAGGRTTTSFTIQYRFQAIAEGTFEIPAFDVVVSGTTYATDFIQLVVSAQAQQTPARQENGLAPEDLFITAEASSTSVLDGEPLVVEYRIWTRVDVTSFGLTSVPEPQGFWVEDVTPPGQPEVEQRTRNGIQYATAVIRRVALVPTGAGTKPIEPIDVEAQVRMRGGLDPFGDFLGRSPFGNRAVPVSVLANPLSIEVRPLPAGRPDPFSGVVGTLSATATIDRDSVDANDAVTLTVTVRGEGNLRVVPAPVLDLPDDFEVFPPEVSESITPRGSTLSGSKTFEYVIIPRAPGRRELPGLEWGYYDIGAGGYRVARTEALPLTVSGTVVEGPAGLSRGGVAELRQDIRFIRLGPLDLRPVGGSPLGSPGFWIFALLPLAGMLGAVGLRRHREMLAGDVAYARGRRAGRVARKRLARARGMVAGDDSRAFYAEVASALRGLAADRLNLAEAGIQTEELTGALAAAGVDDSTRDEVQDCLEHCDRQRFAPPTANEAERNRFLERVGSVMGSLDRALR
jgi:hypothetical protein